MRRMIVGLVVVGACVSGALGWGAEVHRLVTRLALEDLPAGLPGWLRDADTAAAVAFQSNQPDRWRGWDSVTLKHANDPDHFLDAELLAEFGLTLETVPPLRREYIRVLALAKHVHPERVSPYDADKDPARAQEWPGFVLHAASEEYARLQAALNQVRILEQLGDQRRAAQLAQARQVAIYHMGNLSHFVADMAQPLHTTKHYNGWVGENPAGYKWREKFHAYVDEGWALKHALDAAAVRLQIAPDRRVSAQDPWGDLVAHFRRSFERIETLYALERDGQLDGEAGRALLVERLGDAAATLRALYVAAYESAAPTEKQVQNWVRYDATPGLTTQPAGN